MRQACGGAAPRRKGHPVLARSDLHNGWNMDYQALPATDLRMLASPDAAGRRLLEALAPRPGASGSAASETRRKARGRIMRGRPTAFRSRSMARVTTEALRRPQPFLHPPAARLAGRACCRFADPLDYIGFDGGGGIGSGPGMAVGAALALRDGRPAAGRGPGRRRLPDGRDGALDGVHYRVPLLIVVVQQRVVLQRRAAPGAHGARARTTRGESLDRLAHERSATGPRHARARPRRRRTGTGAHASRARLGNRHWNSGNRPGKVCVIDVHVAAEYARAVSSSLLRQIPARS